MDISIYLKYCSKYKKKIENNSEQKKYLEKNFNKIEKKLKILLLKQK